MARYLSPQEGTEQRFCKERVHPEVRRLIISLCAIFHKKRLYPFIRSIDTWFHFQNCC